jgi:hypothetical protein
MAIKGLRHCKPQVIRAGYDGGLDNCLVLDQYALQFERADAVVGGFEDIIHAADVGKDPIWAAAHGIAAAIILALDRPQRTILL